MVMSDDRRRLRQLAGLLAGLWLLQRASLWLRYRAVLYRSKAQLASKERGRVAIVTGAASGVGLEIVLLLGRRGWRVYAVDMDKQGLERLAVSVKAEALDVCGVQLSVSDAIACRRFRETVEEELALSPKDGDGDGDGDEAAHHGVDALVNCAGVVLMAPSLSAPWRDVEAQTRVNFLGPLLLMSLFRDLLLMGPRGGNIVNVSSISGTVGWPWQGAYSATKHALGGCSGALRREALQAGLPLRVAVVEPGPIATPLVASMSSKADGWADDPANANDAFAPAFRAANEYHKRLMDDAHPLRSLKALSLLSARQVAETCVVAAVDDAPQARYVLNAPLFAPMYALLSHLPSALSDRLISLV